MTDPERDALPAPKPFDPADRFPVGSRVRLRTNIESSAPHPGDWLTAHVVERVTETGVVVFACGCRQHFSKLEVASKETPLHRDCERRGSE